MADGEGSFGARLPGLAEGKDEVVRPDVLLGLAAGRADLVARNIEPPYVVNLPPKRASRLEREMKDLGAPFGFPLAENVPDPREEGTWRYLGIVLGDVHVYGRVR